MLAANRISVIHCIVLFIISQSDKGRRKLIDELGNLPAGVSTLVTETGSSGNTLELPTGIARYGCEGLQATALIELVSLIIMSSSANPPTKSMESEQVIKSDDKGMFYICYERSVIACIKQVLLCCSEQDSGSGQTSAAVSGEFGMTKMLSFLSAPG